MQLSWDLTIAKNKKMKNKFDKKTIYIISVLLFLLPYIMYIAGYLFFGNYPEEKNDSGFVLALITCIAVSIAEIIIAVIMAIKNKMKKTGYRISVPVTILVVTICVSSPLILFGGAMIDMHLEELRMFG